MGDIPKEIERKQTRKTMKAIIAINNKGYIGLNGALPWHCKKDLQHFKRMTMGKTLVAGRVTADTLPLLKGREIIVMSRNGLGLDEVLKLKPDFVIGGKQIYDLLIPYCTELHISRINDNTIGDTMYQLPANFKGRVVEYYF